ncbi:MAG TPA: hypothetical protein VKP60_14305 [Magnetospirillaceae bacterium]|nr:hypothetical protein [Magnetospirillaceae bacterium]
MAYGAQMTPVDQINAALKGTVIDTLRLFIPSLAPYTNEEAFNVILNSPEMTQRSFRAFRDHPDAFADLLRGPENQPVFAENEPLSCGRTLAQVVALVVQAVAKRYFRAKLSLRRRNVATVAEPGLMEKVARLFSAPQPPKTIVRKEPSQGDKLFLAMRDNLLFEWQLRLIPHYVGLPVPLVRALGSRLLEFKEIEDIQWMVRTGQPLSAPTVRHSEALAPLHIKADLGPMPAEPIVTPVVEPEVAQMAAAQPTGAEPIELAPLTLPHGVTAQKFVATVLGKVNPPLARWLAREMSLNPRQLALMMLRAYEALPSGDFQRFGACAPHSEEARRFLAAARTARFGLDTSPGKTAEFARLYQAKVKSMM